MDARLQTDWYALLPDAADAVLEAPSYSVNPGFEERRRNAARQFRPSEAPVERPIWEGVEKDSMGRSILVSGDCYRVIDDPNVGSRDAFLTFGQYMAVCSEKERGAALLPWVEEIKSRRAARARSSPPVVE